MVEDPYRWLEEVNNPDTKEWIEQQNKICNRYLSKVLFQSSAVDKIEQNAHIEFNNPKKRGDYYFQYMFNSKYGVPALYYQKKIDDTPQLLVDPASVSYKDNIVINDYCVSKDSTLLAYQFSRNGSDWNEVKIISLKSRIHKRDHLARLKFSHLSWLKDGFFYTTYNQDGQFGKTQNQQVFYHKIGNEQIEDTLVFKRKDNPSVYFDYLTTNDERFFVLQEYNTKHGITNIFYVDYQAESIGLKPMITNLKQYNIKIIDSHEGKFIATARKDSNNLSIMEIDPSNPYQWREISPDYSDAVLLNLIPFKERMVAIYQTNQHPIIVVMEYSGKVIYALEMAMPSTVDGFSGNSWDDEMLYDFSSYTIPHAVYNFNIKTLKKELTKKTNVTYNFDDIEYKEVEYAAKDSVKIPMILVCKKGIKLDGSNPAILKAYGGFGIISHPSFDPGIVYFIEQGGIFAFANIRGGGDKGISWADAGRGRNKQVSFNDFIAAAEYLIDNKYTSKEKLAATGGSNGGLVVAVAAIQRPDLFRAVVPVVAPLDMIRFDQFTVGHWHKSEYGSVTDSLGFKNLLSYSPYHNIRDEVNYPSMLIMTSENDDRVPPFHSYKFVAKLQSRSAQKNPILLRIHQQAGHYGASTRNAIIEEEAELYGFILNELNKK